MSPYDISLCPSKPICRCIVQTSCGRSKNRMQSNRNSLKDLRGPIAMSSLVHPPFNPSGNAALTLPIAHDPPQKIAVPQSKTPLSQGSPCLTPLQYSSFDGLDDE